MIIWIVVVNRQGALVVQLLVMINLRMCLRTQVHYYHDLIATFRERVCVPCGATGTYILYLLVL
jgi:hypothetical protein